MAYDLLIRILTNGSSQAQTDLESVGDSARNMGDELERVGDNDGLERAGQSADRLADALGRARAGGIALGAIGAVGVAISEKFTDAALEVDTLGSLLASMLNGVDLLEARDQVTALGRELALLVGGSPDEIAKNIAQAVSSGRVRLLQQYGIVIDKVGQQAITAAQQISAQAGAQEALNQVLRQSGPALEQLRENSSEASLALGEMDVQWHEISVNIGLGTSRAKADFKTGIIKPILDIIEISPGMQETAGYVYAIGSTAAVAGGSVMGFLAQVGMMIPALQAMGNSGVFAFIKMRIAGVTSFAAIRTAAMSAAVGVNMVTLGVTGIAIAAAATVAVVAFSIGQHLGWLDKERNLLDDVTMGWYGLTDAITGANNAARKHYGDEADGWIEKQKIALEKDVEDGKISREAADEKIRAAEIKARDWQATELRKVGDDEGYLRAREQRRQLDRPSAPEMPAMPAMPTLTAAAPMVADVAGATEEAEKAEKAAPSAKSVSSEAEKLASLQERRDADLARQRNEIEAAKIEEEYNTRIARLRAGEGDNEAVAKKLEAEKRLKVAKLRAGDDQHAQELAKIRYGGEMARAGIVRAPSAASAGGGAAAYRDAGINTQPALGDVMGYLRRGGSVLDSSEAMAGAAGGQSVPPSAAQPRRVNINLRDDQFKKQPLPNSEIEVTFSGRFVVADEVSKALGAV